MAMKQECPKCLSSTVHHSKSGFFVRKSDNRKLRRYICKHCKSTYSQATFQSCYRQKKRRLNPRIHELLNSSVSQRRIAKLLKISRRTVAKKHKFIASVKRIENDKDFVNGPMVHEVQFDDLETIEHTKLKPLSVIMAVEKSTRRILGFRVCQMPAKGHLAKLSRKKYGYRVDMRAKGREDLFKNLALKVSEDAVIDSDQSPHYPGSVRRWFPNATHNRFEGKRGCVAGQGELKKVSFDPLFTLNHTFAMLRANINRLVRKTWCTTKDPERLKDHIEIYVNYHNRMLLKN